LVKLKGCVSNGLVGAGSSIGTRPKGDREDGLNPSTWCAQSAQGDIIIITEGGIAGDAPKLKTAGPNLGLP